MDAGRISARYAKAVYEFALEKGEETRLYEEMKTLSENFLSFRTMSKVMEDPTVLPQEKIKILSIAAGMEVSDTFKSLMRLVIGNKRENYMQMIALMYQEYYRKEKGILIAKLTTTDAVSEDIKNSLRKVIAEQSHEEVDFVTRTDPAIIGGFILELDDKRLDASVRNQLNQIRIQLTE